MICSKVQESHINYYDENGELQHSAETMNWVKWLANRRPQQENLEVKHFLDQCVSCATTLAMAYSLDAIEVFLSETSLHFNYKRNSTFYLCTIPRSLIIRTKQLYPHMEKCVRLQLIREIKRLKKSSQEEKGMSLQAVLPTYGRGWLPVYATSSTSVT